LNVRMLAYPRFLHAILPLVGRDGGRSHSRVLELASGSGELAFARTKSPRGGRAGFGSRKSTLTTWLAFLRERTTSFLSPKACTISLPVRLRR
jgi:hypothetical protein